MKVVGKIAYEAFLPLWSCQKYGPPPEIGKRFRKRVLCVDSRIGDHRKQVMECRLHIFRMSSLLSFIKLIVEKKYPDMPLRDEDEFLLVCVRMASGGQRGKTALREAPQCRLTLNEIEVSYPLGQVSIDSVHMRVDAW
jgi:hypothetical protein